VCADRHLRVRVRGPESTAGATEAERRAAWRAYLRRRHYGIARVACLDGHVGYLDLRLVADADVSGGAVAAAMTLVAGTAALIVDVRRNRGGAPSGAVLWCSYLFPDDQTHLNDIHLRATGEVRQYWTVAHLPAARYLDRPVYVLTSAETFSGGEELCYNLQVRGRATLIGETTGGGANPVDVHPLPAGLEIAVPVARAVNPVTGTNWDGTGVRPDVAVPAGEAFDVAYRMGLAHVLATATDPAVLADARAALGAPPGGAGPGEGDPGGAGPGEGDPGGAGPG
jgi:C-terminal processing protease CtpA/Prc